MNYVDPATFGKLFRARRQNAQAIAMVLAQIADGVSRTVRFASVDDREDATGDALVHAIEQVARYRPRTGSNPFAYFSLCIRRSLIRAAQTDGRRRERVQVGLDGLE